MNLFISLFFFCESVDPSAKCLKSTQNPGVRVGMVAKMFTSLKIETMVTAIKAYDLVDDSILLLLGDADGNIRKVTTAPICQFVQ